MLLSLNHYCFMPTVSINTIITTGNIIAYNWLEFEYIPWWYYTGLLGEHVHTQPTIIAQVNGDCIGKM